MDKIEFSTGGFPLSTDRLADMQQCWQFIAELAKAWGNNAVIHGCSGWATGGAVSDGLIVFNGEMLPFRSGGQGNRVQVIEQKHPITYSDGSQRTFRTTRYATATTSSVTGTLPQSSFAQASQIPQLATAAALAADKISLQSRIDALETRMASLTGNMNNADDALRRMTVPKGTIIMWHGLLPLSNNDLGTREQVLDRIHNELPYGYLPCVNWQRNSAFETCRTTGVALIGSKFTKQDTLDAWNDYLSELGIEQRLSKHLNFSQITINGRAIPNLAGRFPIGSAENIAGNSTGGAHWMMLSEANLPPHQHYVNSLGYGSKSWTNSDNGRRTACLSPGDNTLYSTSEGNGSASEFRITPPYHALFFLIKAI